MENKVSIKLPEWADNVSCQVNNGMVNVEFIPRKEFKDGDILSLNRAAVGIYCVIFRRYNDNKNTFDSYYNNNGIINLGWISSGFRLATEEEKQKLFDAMAKEGLKWNAEKKQVEKIRWRADKDEIYYFFNSMMETERCQDIYDEVDNARYNIGNYSKTKEESKGKAEKIKELLKGD